jgi:uncharacterized membrane protein YgaE (UPF0421/DUF939 family)
MIMNIFEKSESVKDYWQDVFITSAKITLGTFLGVLIAITICFYKIEINYKKQIEENDKIIKEIEEKSMLYKKESQYKNENSKNLVTFFKKVHSQHK